VGDPFPALLFWQVTVVGNNLLKGNSCFHSGDKFFMEKIVKDPQNPVDFNPG
jgi:hypothetical protein